MEEDFAQWYTDVVKKAELVDYSGVRGCTIFRPAGDASLDHRDCEHLLTEIGIEV